jgi:hypothetical protein
VDSSSSLSFESSSSDAKSITLEFSGGQFGDLFSFLPVARTGGNQNVKGAQGYKMSSELAARVVEVDASGKVRLEGSRTVSLQGKEERLSISGWLDPNALGAERQVSFSRLADSRMSFRTFLDPASVTLSAADIEEVVVALGQPAAVAPGPAAAAGPAPGQGAIVGGAAGGAAGQAQTAPATSYSLTNDKKIELFLRYVNRLVDILFQ